MMARRSLVVLFILVMALVAVHPAAADGPEHQQFKVEGGDLFYCDEDGVFVPHDEDGDGWADWADGWEYQLEGRYWANINVHFFFDKDGNLVRAHWQGTFHGKVTRLDTGEFFLDRQVWSQTEDVTDFASNLSWHIVIPGEGKVWHEIGRVIFDVETGEVKFAAGHHPWLEGPAPDFCSLLGDGILVAAHPL